MLKEIHEQPQALDNTLLGHVANGTILAPSFGFKAHDLIDRIRTVHLVACGTSHHAAEVGRYWMESLAGIPCCIDLASEFRYRTPAVPPDCLFIAISQSGETADTLAALRYARRAGYLATLSVCNVPESSLVRESDMVLLTRAGCEIGVASTKTFTSQLLSMLMLAILFGSREQARGNAHGAVTDQLTRASAAVEAVLQISDRIQAVAGRLVHYEHALYLARGQLYPIAREGALKLKEISYIHAEAYAAGELKHGPLALVDENMPVIALAPSNAWLGKIKANLQEVRARGGSLMVFADAAANIGEAAQDTRVEMPRMDDVVLPIGYAVAMQLLAYHVALLRGAEIDQPRNLAKSVTVE
jgi:glucosamine--fructose-6-phosphate aminotransferase (isomerizing)